MSQFFGNHRANQLEEEAETRQWTRIPKFITYEMRGETLGLFKASGKVPSLEEQSTDFLMGGKVTSTQPLRRNLVIESIRSGMISRIFHIQIQRHLFIYLCIYVTVNWFSQYTNFVGRCG